MPGLDIIFAPAARRDIKKFDKAVQIRFVRAIEALATNPRPAGAEKIKGRDGYYRIKAGADHRIIYSVFDQRIVVVLVLRDRKDAYRGLDDLDGKLKAALVESAEKAKSAGRGRA